MSNKSEKPYVLRAAEFVYSNIINIKKQNPEINNIQAFEIFMTSKEYDILSSGEFHDKWFLELKNNKFIDKITKKKINYAFCIIFVSIDMLIFYTICIYLLVNFYTKNLNEKNYCNW